MPNDCQNVLFLSHRERSKLEAATEAMRNRVLLAYFRSEPLYSPELAARLCEDYRTRDSLIAKNVMEDRVRSAPWRYWREIYWGTKWDIFDATEPTWLDNKRVELRFSTAWSPPLAAYDAASDQHGFDVIAYFNEEGMGFAGKYVSHSEPKVFGYLSKASVPAELDDIFHLADWVDAFRSGSNNSALSDHT